MDKRKNNGGVRLNAGRKSKDEEQRLSKLLSPYVTGAVEKLIAIIDNTDTKDGDKLTAIRLLFNYHSGMPKQQTELEVTENKLFTGIPDEDVSEYLDRIFNETKTDE